LSLPIFSVFFRLRIMKKGGAERHTLRRAKRLSCRIAENTDKALMKDDCQTISGNMANDSGGVYIWSSSGRFVKRGGVTINATNAAKPGRAVYIDRSDDGNWTRNSAAGRQFVENAAPFDEGRSFLGGDADCPATLISMRQV
jgi:hypothetical protein